MASHRSTSTREGGAPPHRRTGIWVAVFALLAVGIVVPLLVPIYDSSTPTLFGFPFYYWFQFALIPVVSLLTYTAFRLSLRATEQDRPRFGLRPDVRPQDRDDHDDDRDPDGGAAGRADEPGRDA